MTINDSNIDLNKFPASEVRQLAKKVESSKAKDKHINQVASNPQAAQINLMHHRCTGLPPSKFKRKHKPFTSRQDNNKQHYEEKQRERMPQVNKKYDNYQVHTSTSQERYSKCGDSQHIEGFRCPANKHQCKNCHKYGHFSTLHYRKREAFDKKRSLESRSPKAHQLQISAVIMQDSICGQSEDLSSSNDSFCLQLQLQSIQVETKIPAPQHLITNVAYKLKANYKKTQYLRARLDTCVDVNILPVSLYKLA